MPDEEGSLAAKSTALEESPSVEDAFEGAPPAKGTSGMKTCRADPTASRPIASWSTASRPDSPTASRIEPANIVRTPSAETPPAKTSSAQIKPEDQAAEEGGAEKTRSGAAAAAEAATRYSSRESPRASVATEILD
ncbi:hypothetical protein AXG93_2471s1180 [Marchantia polymorpha subsp. ruderalis]|uniref:Uncharacterized protein n=1 Tax=Marchantia polymorpha subsp. ruderalis TaxID=1480154 RepID=A0A176W111_MARPO|nr:hypothetical protein AXG93_2471s1180 [Marchantia polymorpha subsp. ruderalis]